MLFLCSGAPRASPIRENLVITWPYTDRPTDRSPDRPSAPQGNECLLSHFLASLGVQEKTNRTSILWSIDSCQNTVSADQYHLTVLRAQLSTHRGRVLFEVIRWQITSVSNDRRLKFIFSNDSYHICCVYVTMAPHYQDFDFKLTSDAKIQPVF